MPKAFAGVGHTYHACPSLRPVSSSMPAHQPLDRRCPLSASRMSKRAPLFCIFYLVYPSYTGAATLSRLPQFHNAHRSSHLTTARFCVAILSLTLEFGLTQKPPLSASRDTTLQQPPLTPFKT